MSTSLEQARKAKEALSKTLAGEESLVGVGLTKVGDDYAVKVNLSGEPEQAIPDSVAGVPVVVEVVGKIRKRDQT